MWILAIDCCSDRPAAALHGPRPAASSGPSGSFHLSALMPLVQSLLRDAGINSPDGMAVTRGPGPFSGLRVGLTTARTLAQVWNVPLYGIVTLDAMAATVRPASADATQVTVATDARKGEVFVATYRITDDWPQLEGEYEALKPAQLAARLEGQAHTLIGSGFERYREMFPHHLPPPHPEAVATELAKAAAGVYRNLPPSDTSPFYLRPPDATVPAFLQGGPA